MGTSRNWARVMLLILVPAGPGFGQLGMGDGTTPGDQAVTPVRSSVVAGVERPTKSVRVETFRPDADVNGFEPSGAEPQGLAIATLIVRSFEETAAGPGPRPSLVAMSDGEKQPRAAAAFVALAKQSGARVPARPAAPAEANRALVETLLARFATGKPAAIWVSSREGGRGLVAFRVDEFPDRFEILAHDPRDPPNLRGSPQLRRVVVSRAGGALQVLFAAFRAPDRDFAGSDAVQLVDPAAEVPAQPAGAGIQP